MSFFHGTTKSIFGFERQQRRCELRTNPTPKQKNKQWKPESPISDFLFPFCQAKSKRLASTMEESPSDGGFPTHDGQAITGLKESPGIVVAPDQCDRPELERISRTNLPSVPTMAAVLGAELTANPSFDTQTVLGLATTGNEDGVSAEVSFQITPTSGAPVGGNSLGTSSTGCAYPLASSPRQRMEMSEVYPSSPVSEVSYSPLQSPRTSQTEGQSPGDRQWMPTEFSDFASSEYNSDSSNATMDRRSKAYQKTLSHYLSIRVISFHGSIVSAKQSMI